MPGTPAKIDAALAATLCTEADAGASVRELAAKYDLGKTRVAEHVKRERERRAEVAAERLEVEALRREARAAERRAAPPPPTTREAELLAAVNAATPGSPEHEEAKLWLRRYRKGRPSYVPLPSETGQPVERSAFGRARPRAIWENPYER